MRRLERSKIKLPVWGATGIAVTALLAVLVFAGAEPLNGRPLQIRALFNSDAALVIGSPVRVAGVDVGTVSQIEPVNPRAGVAAVVISLDSNAPPIHANATAAIRPRLILEGNFFIDLKPGTAAAPLLHSNGAIGLDHTTGPVQLDRVLSDLPSATRTDLQTVLQGLGQSFGATAQGEPAAVALNHSFADLPGAESGTARTLAGLRGEQPHDLSHLVEGSSRVLSALASNHVELADLVSHLNRTLAATASRQGDLSRTLELLPPVLQRTDATLSALDRTFPSARAFAASLTSSIAELPGTIEAGFPWVDQTTKLFSRQELGRLLVDLAPATRDSAAALGSARSLFSQLNLLGSCALNDLVPSSDAVIKDPPLPANGTVAQEFFQGVVGFVSAAQNLDGNGRYVRAQPAGGPYPVHTSRIPYQQGSLLGNATNPPLGTRPAFPGSAPPFRTDVPCGRNRPANVNSARTGVGP